MNRAVLCAAQRRGDMNAVKLIADKIHRVVHRVLTGSIADRRAEIEEIYVRANRFASEAKKTKLREA